MSLTCHAVECFHIISAINNPSTGMAEKGLGLGRRFCRLCNILTCATLIIWLLPSRPHTDICISIYLFCFTELSGSHFMLASHSHGLVCKKKTKLYSSHLIHPRKLPQSMTKIQCSSLWWRVSVSSDFSSENTSVNPGAQDFLSGCQGQIRFTVIATSG